MHKKSLKLYVTLLVLPYIIMLSMLAIQVIARLLISNQTGDESAVLMFINIISLIGGTGAVLLILSSPVWIILLIRDSRNNKKVSSQKQKI